MWYDPSDLNTLFQDRSATPSIPAVLDGPVGTMLDKSGRNNHAIALSDDNRPLLKQDANGRYCLLFDGADDGFVSAFNPPLDSAITAVFAAKSNAGSNSIGAYGTVGTTRKLFVFSHQYFGEWYVFSNGVDNDSNVTITEQQTGLNHVATWVVEVGRPLIFRFNGSNNLSTNLNPQVARTGEGTSYIGRREETISFLKGFCYGYLYYAKVLNSEQLAMIERYMAKKARVTLL